MSQSEASQWQKNITGEWYGCPAVFNEQGTHIGFIKVNRSSQHSSEKTTYLMSTELDVQGSLRSKFEAQNFSFGVIDSDQDRIYLGPDFYGSGQPYGQFVNAHYYAPGWNCDLKTMVHILEDGHTQVYSSQLYEGPKLVAVFNGLYQMATDYESNEETKKTIDRFVQHDKDLATNPHILPMKKSGTWSGTLQCYDNKQAKIGDQFVSVDYKPQSLLRSEINLKMEGPLNLNLNYIRSRTDQRHEYCGPDLFGSGISYGRAHFSSQHITAQSLRMSCRDFFIDQKNTISAVWQVYKSNREYLTMFGTLKWEEGESLLTANYQ